jgi:OpgC protein
LFFAAAILSIKAMGLRAAGSAHLYLDKHDLGLMRLAHFLALAYVMSAIAIVQPWATAMNRMVGSRMGQSFQGIGRNSLLFFALGSVASTGGRSLMAAAQSLATPHLSVHIIGLVYTAAAVTGMFVVVNRMNRTAYLTGVLAESRDAVPPMTALRADARRASLSSRVSCLRAIRPRLPQSSPARSAVSPLPPA